MALEPRRTLGETGAYALELAGVGRRFGALAALADITMSVRAGERRAVLGSNGAGKTTLFNTITGDFAPSTGAIRFFGEDVTRFPAYERIRRGLRRTYQISQLFGGLSRASIRSSSPAAACRATGSRCCARAATTRRWSRRRASCMPCASTRVAGTTGRRTQPRPAAAARDRPRLRRRAALHPVRRAGRRPVADTSGATSSTSSPRCRRISATSSSSTISTWRCASPSA